MDRLGKTRLTKIKKNNFIALQESGPLLQYLLLPSSLSSVSSSSSCRSYLAHSNRDTSACVVAFLCEPSRSTWPALLCSERATGKKTHEWGLALTLLGTVRHRFTRWVEGRDFWNKASNLLTQGYNALHYLRNWKDKEKIQAVVEHFKEDTLWQEIC